jgi:hypothetical protein
VPLIVLPLKLLSCLIEFDLGGLGLSDLFFEIGLFPANLDRQLFDLEVEIFDLGIILLPVFLEGDVVLLLLLASNRPLLQLLLVPVQLQF